MVKENSTQVNLVFIVGISYPEEERESVVKTINQLSL